MTVLTPPEAEDLIRDRFDEKEIVVVDLTLRQYPDESVFILLVDEFDVPAAAALGNDLDDELAESGFKGFVTVRAAPKQRTTRKTAARGLADTRVTELVRLIASRSRASEVQPSLAYVRDAAHNIAIVTQPRHHLIFGRRGAGKTSLMVEAKTTADKEEHTSVWVNLQSHRFEPVERAFLWVVRAIAEQAEVEFQNWTRSPQVATWAADLLQRSDSLLAKQEVSLRDASRLIPETQRMLRRFTDSTGHRVFIFLDDFHYMPRALQPQLLDMLHGCVRDADAWLKIATIRHLSRWFQSPPPIGLQTGQDADHIDLDVTLEDPMRAKNFLEQVLTRYASHVGIRALSAVFSPDALNRLVLASGGVPRDYLVLSSRAILRARTRANARTVGVQDVTNAAGEAAQAKVSELEEDISSNETPRTLMALDGLRGFLEQTNWTYFRVGFTDRERHPAEYVLLTNLLEARLLHLISPSVSDAHKAGARYEAFMLDLSQFSGQRFKKFIHVLDFEGGHLVARQTNKPGSSRRGDTARRLVTILRRAPELDLATFTDED